MMLMNNLKEHQLRETELIRGGCCNYPSSDPEIPPPPTNNSTQSGG